MNGSSAVAAGIPPAKAPAWRSLGGWPLRRLLPVVLILLAVAQQLRSGLDCDVSWLLTAGEKMQGGARLYRDLLEVNPPASVLLYLPAILAGRALGLTPETVIVIAVPLLATGIVFACGGLLRARLMGDGQLAALLPIALFALLVLPADCFAQREHIALLAVLPMLAALALRADGAAVSLPAAVCAGLGGGIALAVKPHFALAILPPAIWNAWRRRSLRPLFAPELLAAGGIAAAYGISVLLLFPDYLTDMAGLLATVYLPSRTGPVDLLRGPALCFAAPLALATLAITGRRLPAPVGILLVAAAGFAAAALIQGKGYLNHGYPGTALAMLALAAALTGPAATRADRRLGVLALSVIGLIAFYSFANVRTYPGLEAAVARVAPPHPRILVAGSELALGHPLTRRLEGEWVGSRASLWITGNAQALLARENPSSARAAALRALIREDQDAFIADVLTGRPDVVLVDGAWGRAFVASDPRIGRALRPFRPAARSGDILVLVRERTGR